MTAIHEPAAGSVLQPARERRIWQLADLDVRDSGNGEDFTLRGHAAVFGKLSEDLGGFRELIEPGFFRSALRRGPDVRCLINHDGYPVLARTASGTLELREDGTGLHVWARVAKNTGFGSDLAASMQRGDIDQMSFAFTIAEGGDDWAVTEDGTVVRTLRADGCRDLFDVSVVTFPAYPQTDASMREVYQRALDTGRLPAAPDDPAGADQPHDTGARKLRVEIVGGQQDASLRTDALKEQARGAASQFPLIER